MFLKTIPFWTMPGSEKIMDVPISTLRQPILPICWAVTAYRMARRWLRPTEPILKPKAAALCCRQRSPENCLTVQVGERSSEILVEVKMHIWTINKWEKNYNISGPNHRTGVRLKFDKDIACYYFIGHCRGGQSAVLLFCVNPIMLGRKHKSFHWLW